MSDPYKKIEVGGTGIPGLNRVLKSDSNASEGLKLDTNGQQALIASKGWVRFISVMGFIVFGFAVLGIVSLIVSISYTGGFGLIQVIIMSVMAVVLFKLANGLSKFSSAITRMMVSYDPIDFEIAMNEQMKFWKLFGILTLIWVILAFFGVLAGLA